VADHGRSAARTRTFYGYLLRRFLLPAFEETPLGRIDLMTVRTWLAGLHELGEVTPTTIAKAYRLLRRILNVAVEAGYLPRNPVAIKGAGLERAAEMRQVSIPQLHALAEAVPGRYRALVVVAGYGKTSAGQRVVVPPAVAVSALADHLEEFVTPGPDGLVFPSGRAPTSSAATSAGWCGARRSSGSAWRACASTTYGIPPRPWPLPPARPPRS
jgi:hypothetical protein